MKRINDSVPFRIYELDGDQIVDGSLRMTTDYLIINAIYKDKDADLIKSDLRSFKIPLFELENVDFKKGILKNLMFIKCSSPASFEDLPQHKKNVYQLVVKHSYRKLAIDFVERVREVLKLDPQT